MAKFQVTLNRRSVLWERVVVTVEAENPEEAEECAWESDPDWHSFDRDVDCHDLEDIEELT